MSLISSVEFSEYIPSHVRKLLERAADCSKKDQWELALSLSTIALEELENVLESDSHDVGLILLIVGFINTKIDKYDEAENAWRRAVPIFEKYNRGSIFVVEILWNLVELFIKNEKYDDAQFFGRKVIRIHEKLQKIDRFELAKQLVTIGEVFLRLKKPFEAKRFFMYALTIYAEKSGINSAQIEKIFRSLEIAFFWRDNIIESKKRLENAKNCRDVVPFVELGQSCAHDSPYKAIYYYQRCIKIYESSRPSKDPQLAFLNWRLGECYLKIDNPLAAQLCLEKSRATYKKMAIADDNLNMLDVNIHLALCYVKSAKLDKARKTYEEILSQVHTDGCCVSIIKLAENFEKSVKDEVPIPNEKSDIIDCALKNLSALYVLDGKYRAAKILQDFRKSKHI